MHGLKILSFLWGRRLKTRAVNLLVYLITIIACLSVVNLRLMIKLIAHVLTSSKYTLKLHFSSFLHSYWHGWGQICFFYANVCFLLLQQSKTTNTVQNILQNNLRGAACSRKYAESVTWLTQVQQAITDLPIAVDSLSHVELSRVKNIHSINRNFC